MPHEAPSTETFIPAVMSRSTCTKHNVAIDEPCYSINDDEFRGVCNARAKRAGYDHPISAKSKMNRVGTSETTRRKDR